MSEAAIAIEHARMRCGDCHLLLRPQPLPAGATARCPRCGTNLYSERPNSLDHALSLTVAALLLWAVANFATFLTFEYEGREQSNYIVSGVIQLYGQGYWPLAFLILFASVVAPLVHLSGMLYVLVPVRLGGRPPGLGVTFRFLQWLRPWSMLEVYLLGVLVAIVKLSELASITPGVGSYAFFALILVSAASYRALDDRIIWQRVREGL